ncbi:MAG: hypothetical protein FWG14_08490 [Peptococcaceae bacterium]|nr:hypothetical protein [Peptococcaceae bacterium]
MGELGIGEKLILIFFFLVVIILFSAAFLFWDNLEVQVIMLCLAILALFVCSKTNAKTKKMIIFRLVKYSISLGLIGETMSLLFVWVLPLSTDEGQRLIESVAYGSMVLICAPIVLLLGYIIFSPSSMVKTEATIVSIQLNSDGDRIYSDVDATLNLSIQKKDGTSYEKTLQVRIPGSQLPLYQPGKKHEILYQISDPSKVMIIHPRHPRTTGRSVASIDSDEFRQ